MSQLIHLTSHHHSLVIKVGRVPEIIHWGNKINALDDDLILATERPISQARLDVDVPLSLCPELGSGHFNAPGIEGHRDGYHWAPVFTLTDTEQTTQDVRFTLIDDIAALEMVIEIRMDYQSDVVQKGSRYAISPVKHII